MESINNFLASYSDNVRDNALLLREVVIANLPGIIEQVDLPARMIAYCYGQKYSQLICTIIPSKKGLKLGFNRGSSLPDPYEMLEGTGKISRYVVIMSEADIKHAGIKQLISTALEMYREISNS